MSLAAAKTESWAQGRISVLDIGAYLAGGAGAAAPLAHAIARTCEDTGFLVVANHGVPQHLVDDTCAVAERFFTRAKDGRARQSGRELPLVQSNQACRGLLWISRGRTRDAGRVRPSRCACRDRRM